MGLHIQHSSSARGARSNAARSAASLASPGVTRYVSGRKSATFAPWTVSLSARSDFTIMPLTVIALLPRAWLVIGTREGVPPNPSRPSLVCGIAQRSAMSRSNEDADEAEVQSGRAARTRSTAAYMELPPGLLEYT